MDDKREQSVDFWKEKYEDAEKKLQELKILAHKGIADYDELQRKYDQNQKQYDEVRAKLDDADFQLKELRRVVEPAYKEFNQLNELYNIEKGCRSEAERYASRISKDNQKLKRQSQMLLDKVSALPEPMSYLKELDEISLAGSDMPEAGDDKRVTELNVKVEKLEEQLGGVEDQLVQAEEERQNAVVREQDLKQELSRCQDTLRQAQETIVDHEQTMKNVSTVSTVAYDEYVALREKYNDLLSLQNEAEKYASKMLSERDAVVRESSVLIASATSDKRLHDALMKIEDLSKEIEQERITHKHKVRELETVVEESSEAERLDALQSQLDATSAQMEQTQKQYTELEKYKLKLERENRDLTDKLDVAEQKLKHPPPPPPPPLPPAGLFKIFRPFKKNTKKGGPAESLVSPLRRGPHDPKFDDALKEMMKRIQSGGGPSSFLRSNVDRRDPPRKPSLPETPSSAMEDLQRIMANMKRRKSTGDGKLNKSPGAPTSPRYGGGPGAASSGMTELQETIMKVRAKDLSLIEEESGDGDGSHSGSQATNSASSLKSRGSTDSVQL